MNLNKKVSIIVPVYNAEKYLGYCLNSILSQTYVNWEAILVDDGSSDNSLEICKNYAQLDNRFHVYSKENGGVSSARNYGLSVATGDYLEFLDSDDCLDVRTLEKQVTLAAKYTSQIIIMNVLKVDFEKPELERTLLNSSWLKESPCCLSQLEFREIEMQLILHTALLEGCYGKLYDASIWRQENFSFPEGLSLGEDFVTNLKYYSACDRIVFLNECGYYYGNSTTENYSLTHQYREDLFEIKMSLMREIENTIGSFQTLSEPENSAFQCYAASSGLSCVENILHNDNKSKEEKTIYFRHVMEDPIFAQSLQNAPYTPERFAECKKKLLQGQFAQITKNDISLRSVVSPRGFAKRIILKTMRFIGSHLPENSYIGKLVLRLEAKFDQLGVIVTIKNHLSWRKHVTRKEFTAQINRIHEESTQAICDVELRLSSENYLREINNLRQRKKVIMLATAEHQNIGDAAITLAEQYLLQQQFSEYYQVEISTYEFKKKEEYLHAIVNPLDILIINGGGNIGDIYLAEELLHQYIICQFPNNRIIIMPQTIYFKDLDGKVFRDSQHIYNQHRDLTIYLRGQESLSFAKMYYPNAKSFLMPDTVHLLRTNYSLERTGALLCIREDEESNLSTSQRDSLRTRIEAMFSDVEQTTNIHSMDILRNMRGLVVRQELMRFAQHKVVITDRLHGMIFAAITATPCVVLSSYNQKIWEYYRAFLSESNAIFFLDDKLDGLEAAIKSALKVENAVYSAESLEKMLGQIC